MTEGLDSTKSYRAKVQRALNGAVLGVCLMVGAEDLSFVDSGDEWIRIKKTKTETGLIIEIGAGDSVILREIAGAEENPTTGHRWYDRVKESVRYIGRNLVPLVSVLDILFEILM